MYGILQIFICPRGHTYINTYLGGVSEINEKNQKWNTYDANDSVTKLCIKGPALPKFRISFPSQLGIAVRTTGVKL